MKFMDEALWMLAGLVAVLVLYGVWLVFCWCYERLRYTKEERWQRRYDRKLKRHFKSM